MWAARIRRNETLREHEGMGHAIPVLREFPVRGSSGEKRTQLRRARLSPDTRGDYYFSHGICYFDTPTFVFARLQPIAFVSVPYG
jgi:hypothetical protein